MYICKSFSYNKLSALRHWPFAWVYFELFYSSSAQSGWCIAFRQHVSPSVSAAPLSWRRDVGCRVASRWVYAVAVAGKASLLRVPNPNLILAKPEHVVPTCHILFGWAIICLLSRLVNCSVLGASNKVTSPNFNLLSQHMSENRILKKLWVNPPFSDPNGLG